MFSGTYVKSCSWHLISHELMILIGSFQETKGSYAGKSSFSSKMYKLFLLSNSIITTLIKLFFFILAKPNDVILPSSGAWLMTHVLLKTSYLESLKLGRAIQRRKVPQWEAKSGFNQNNSDLNWRGIIIRKWLKFFRRASSGLIVVVRLFIFSFVSTQSCLLELQRQF